jgi:dienelactone hydrolase
MSTGKSLRFALILTLWGPVLLNAREFETAHSTGTPSSAAFAQLLRIALENPPVEVTSHGSRTEEGLSIEDVSWEAVDGEIVPAYVLRPLKGDRPLPAIICLHGSTGSRESMITSEFGVGSWVRAGDNRPHQRMLGWARQLAREGYLVVSLTQRGLDTRSPDTNDRAKEQLVRGRTVMGAIVLEIRQAISYLHQRPDVDPSRIGLTGMSFGGITSFYTWLVDDRVAAIASICGGVGSVDLFLSRGSRRYHGFYWWIPGMLEVGDQGDFAAAMAPRPLMLWAPLEDIGMPREGVDRFLQQVQPAYREAGKPENLVIHRPAGGHSFTPEAFQAMQSFFDRFLIRERD